MRALDRKLLRDLVTLRGPLLSIALVVAAAVMSVITMWCTFRSLEAARDEFFAEYRFADVFASLERAPERVARRIEAIPDVARVETRVVLEVVLTVPGLARAATGHVVSIPDAPRIMLNALHVRAGRWPAADRDDEVLVSERFATLNRLSPGDTVGAVLNGRHRTLHVVGVALSPEFIYEVTPAGGFVSDERLYGVLWMIRPALAAASNMEGAFNDVTLRLAPRADERFVLERLDALLEPYGALGAYGRDDQLSNRIINDEIAQNRATAITIPVVFLSVAAFLLHIVLARLVATQREQIALLKAFGYEDRVVATHYLLLAFLAVAAGALAGLLAGMWLGRGYTSLYSQYFRFPNLEFRMDGAVAVAAMAISGAAAFAGTASTVRGVARLQPAVAMRAEAPASFRPLLLERWNLHSWLSSVQRMILRNLERRPVRALFAAIGVGFALAVLLVGLILLDSVDGMMDRQFRVVQREDMAVVFTNVRSIRSVRELTRIPGVLHAEPYRVVPVELHRGHIRRRLALTGLPADGRLRPMIDALGGTHDVPANGVVLTRKLAGILHVGPGDTVRAELLDRGGEERRLVVAALMDELLGVNAYMTLPELNRLLHEGPQVNGANLQLERGAETGVFAALRDVPAIASTTSKAAMLQSFEAQMAEGVRITMSILLALAAVLAVGIIYNGARIALSERGRELAGLRVLGFSRREVAGMLLGEQAVVTFAGLPIGVLVGYGVAMLIARAYDTELYRMPVVFRSATALSAAAVIVLIAAAAGWLVRRRLDRTDLIAVLKSRE